MKLLNTERTELFTEDLNNLSGIVVDCAVQIHKKLGPGLLESAYQQALAHLLIKSKISFEKEKLVPVVLDDLQIDAGYRADFIINNQIIVETKSVEKLVPLHTAQILTYMKLGGFKLGLLLNFNTPLMKDGIQRFRI
ncbi:MAG: GxxExxY protein [Micavibrio aeruginosavorus]|uniref:GxxExxY protein n=1 Tax=Micavibrio aeruginosavorus TaxID=349221 RepID=A0A2W5PMF8_9BACT|nr:MAG: GxxExxY protein [Micavibrio aeruginosavorus]